MLNQPPMATRAPITTMLKGLTGVGAAAAVRLRYLGV